MISLKKLMSSMSMWTLVASIAILALVWLSYTILRQETELYRIQTRDRVAEVAYEVAHRIDIKIKTLEAVSSHLSGVTMPLSEVPEHVQDYVVQAVRMLHPEVRSVGLEVNSGSALVSSSLGSGSADPSGDASMTLARPVLAGPLDAVDGMGTFTIRYPFSSSRTNRPGESVSGTISIDLPASTFLAPVSDRRSEAESLAIALRTLEGGGQKAYGDPRALAADPVVEQVPLSRGQWSILVIPENGWPTASPDFGLIVTLLAVLMVSTAVGIGGTHYLFFQRERTHKFLANAVEALDAGFVLYDEDDKLRICNSRFKDQFGPKKDAVRPGVSYDTLIRLAGEYSVPASEMRHGLNWLEQRMMGHASGQEFLTHNPNGSWSKVSETRTADGFSVSVITDITTLKEAQLIAETANRQKTEFLSTVTHELRTPLTVIGGYAQILSDDALLPERGDLLSKLKAPEGVESALYRSSVAYDGAVKSYSGKICTWTHHMLNLVNDLLEWAHLERDATKLEVGDVDVSKLLDAVVEDMRPQAEAKGLGLTAEKIAGVVRADPRRLRQVLDNLVGNAIKFTRQGFVTVKAHQEGDRLLLTVEDTGCGIPEADLERIFERFQQVDNSSTREHGGFGLGLSIAARIVELHGGTVSASSRGGNGSRFTVDLPEAGPQELTVTGGVESHHSSGKMSLLRAAAQ